MSMLFGRVSSLMCTKKKDGMIIVKYADKQVNEIGKAHRNKDFVSAGSE